VVRLLVRPRGQDHQGAEAGHLGPADLGDDVLHRGGDGQQDHPAVVFGVFGDELREPAVVRAGAGHAQLRVLVAARAEAHAEGGGGAAVPGVGVREHDLGGHAVAVQPLQPLRGVPAVAPPFF
jgi:hypothetical protein